MMAFFYTIAAVAVLYAVVIHRMKRYRDRYRITQAKDVTDFAARNLSVRKRDMNV